MQSFLSLIWTATSEFGTYRLCEQQRFRQACASAQSRQNLRCSLIQAVSQEEPSDRKPDPWPLWNAGHAQLKFVMMECSKTQIRLTGLIWLTSVSGFASMCFQDHKMLSNCMFVYGNISGISFPESLVELPLTALLFVDLYDISWCKTWLSAFQEH